MTVLSSVEVSEIKMDIKDLSTLFIESERSNKSNGKSKFIGKVRAKQILVVGSSRRPSNESTCSLNVPLEEEITTITGSLLEKPRSHSLASIDHKQQRAHTWEPHEQLNGIEESPVGSTKMNYRRGSLQNERVSSDTKKTTNLKLFFITLLRKLRNCINYHWRVKNTIIVSDIKSF